MTAHALAGVRVIEAADAHGEWCGKLLADMGADVIKVEPPAGAATRAIGPFVDDQSHPDRSLYFWHYNTGKRSVTLDVGEPDGASRLRALLATADVFIETLPPGRAAALGLDYALLAAANQRLIHVAITPFGQTGPYVDSGYRTTDLVSMALGGPMQSCGYDAEDGPDLPPVRPGDDHSYHTASHYACISTLVALIEREASGLGQYVDVSAQASLAVTVEFANVEWEYARRIVRRRTGRHAFPWTTARTQYICADGRYINLGIPRERNAWLSLVSYLQSQGLGEGLDDVRYLDASRYSERAGAALERLEVLCALHSANDLFHIGQRLGLTWGDVRAPEDWLDDEHARARGFFVEVEHPELGRTITYPGAPYQFSETPWRIEGRAPLLGEHTDEVLAELGTR